MGDEESETVVWPDGADVDPDVLMLERVSEATVEKPRRPGLNPRPATPNVLKHVTLNTNGTRVDTRNSWDSSIRGIGD